MGSSFPFLETGHRAPLWSRAPGGWADTGRRGNVGPLLMGSTPVGGAEGAGCSVRRSAAEGGRLGGTGPCGSYPHDASGWNELRPHGVWALTSREGEKLGRPDNPDKQ